MPQSAFHKNILQEPTRLSWSVYQMSGSPPMIYQRHAMIFLAGVLAWGMFYLIWRPAIDNDLAARSVFFSTAAATVIWFLKVARQKTVYHYEIYRSHAKLTHWLYYSELEVKAIKYIAIIIILIFAAMVLVTGSLLFLVGPAAIGFLAALRLMNWQNPVTHEDSLPWHEYNFVTVDRKRRVIVTHRTDITLGFEARLPDDELFEKYLALLRTSLPPTAEFMEKKWDLDLL